MPVTSWFKPGGALKSIAHEQQRRMNKAAHTLAIEVKQSFQKAGTLKNKRTGKSRYTRTSSGGQKATLHKPSEPGETPAIQTGTLRRSIIADILKDGGEYIGLVGPMATVGRQSLKYAKWLELGTRKMKPRPYLRPAVEKLKRKIYNILARG